jgi:hypothetical protein
VANVAARGFALAQEVKLFSSNDKTQMKPDGVLLTAPLSLL